MEAISTVEDCWKIWLYISQQRKWHLRACGHYVYFPVGLVDSVCLLHSEQVKFLEKISEEIKITNVL